MSHLPTDYPQHISIEDDVAASLEHTTSAGPSDFRRVCIVLCERKIDISSIGEVLGKLAQMKKSAQISEWLHERGPVTWDRSCHMSSARDIPCNPKSITSSLGYVRDGLSSQPSTSSIASLSDDDGTSVVSDESSVASITEDFANMWARVRNRADICSPTGPGFASVDAVFAKEAGGCKPEDVEREYFELF